MQTLEREIKRSVIKIKKRLTQSKTIRAELRIQSSINRMEYRLLFRRKHARDLGDFYLASAGKMVRLHEVMLYYLLKNVRKGNYQVSSILTALEDRSFKERLHIYSTGPFKQKGEIRK